MDYRQKAAETILEKRAGVFNFANIGAKKGTAIVKDLTAKAEKKDGIRSTIMGAALPVAAVGSVGLAAVGGSAISGVPLGEQKKCNHYIELNVQEVT